MAKARNGLMSSKTQAALPNVPITKSCSLGCITKSFVETVGKPAVHFIHFSPASREIYKPSSVPKNSKLALIGSSTILNV